MEEEARTITQTGLTMADENIRRIDQYISQMDEALNQVYMMKAHGIIPSISFARIVWMNVKNKLSEMGEEELYSDVENVFAMLDKNVIGADLTKMNADQIRMHLLRLGDLMHKSTDAIGIGIPVRRRRQKNV